jgi:outer membrane translocation and assembly module TamA
VVERLGSRHDPSVTRTSARWASLSFALLAAGCATIPAGRYGVESVRFQGVQQMDALALAACLGTRQRPRVSLDFGLRGTPECGRPPFDASHLLVELWSWPWESWPLVDESVLERDIQRIERWYRARGFYGARVVATELSPPLAPRTERSEETCGAGEGTDCSVDVTFTIEEGEPSRVVRSALRGLESLPAGMRERLRAVIRLQDGDRFDEALYEESKREMLRVLLDAGYARARVQGEVKVRPERREVFQVFVIEPGLPTVFGRVCLRGHVVRDAEGRVTRSLPGQPLLDVATLDPGAPCSAQALEDVQRALYGLGVVSGVEVSLRNGDEGGDNDEDPDEDELCNPGPATIPPGVQPVDVLVRVTPGRIDRLGFGAGLQAGQALTLGTTTTLGDEQDAAQWDIHASFLAEHRNLFDRLIRGRFEVRPRVIFQMPFLNFTPAEPSPFGIQTSGSLRWPAFLEPRTNFLVQVRHDLGPMPFTNLVRSELDGSIGLDRAFFDGRLYTAFFLHANWFFPTDRQPVEPRLQLPETAAMWLEQSVRVDLRDNPRNPTRGAFFAISSQQAVQPLGSWDLVRVTGEARGYIPLGEGDQPFAVLAARFQLGVMEVFGSSLDPSNVYQLAQLGPPALQLIGGGASSNRGFLPGLLGDAEQIYVPSPRTEAETAAGAPPRTRPVRISGGTRTWEASLELRLRVTQSLGIVVFGDAGDVNRVRPDDLETGPSFRFDHPQVAFGFGIRYLTILGPIRLDVAFRPDDLQVIGTESTLPPPCGPTDGNQCRPVSRMDVLGLFNFPGAFHLTIGEAF